MSETISDIVDWWRGVLGATEGDPIARKAAEDEFNLRMLVASFRLNWPYYSVEERERISRDHAQAFSLANLELDVPVLDRPVREHSADGCSSTSKTISKEEFREKTRNDESKHPERFVPRMQKMWPYMTLEIRVDYEDHYPKTFALSGLKFDDPFEEAPPGLFEEGDDYDDEESDF